MSQYATLLFMMGPTCAGKSTLLANAHTRLPKNIGLVEVGKELRAKYPPDYFAGQNNPTHTAAEAWDLCVKGVERECAAGKTHILIDGQPRDVAQVHRCLDQFPRNPKRFILLHASLAKRKERAMKHRSDDPKNLELAMQRLTNDMISYYDVIATLLLRGAVIDAYDTTDRTDSPESVRALSVEILRF